MHALLAELPRAPLSFAPLQVAPSIGCMYFLFEVFMNHSARLPQLNLRLPQQAAPKETVAAAVASG